ncbi:hypothetical protein DA2_0843 [Desulfovibrio sp. A2]|nr:hypothetical protein DA2_0843 [Desulfovibrio sp. A2]
MHELAEMDTLEWMLWPARWAILTIGLLAQLAALALAMRRAAARACSPPSPLRGRLPESSAAPGSGPADGSPSVTAASALRILRGLLLTGGGLVAVFALLERDMLLLAGQALVLPLLWPRLR